MSGVAELRVRLQNVCQDSLETLDEFKGQAAAYEVLITDLRELDIHDESHVRIRESALNAIEQHRTALLERTAALEELITGLFTLSSSLLKADQNKLNKQHDS